ncbi:MAG: 1-acyl-sn-glycerol-3-phosphate acyltransferase [Deltaproteobacteria bacterium]|jgi:1-acyl-sn-glycerol-3-phosphate acyltransferase|nr:1-acyl-sn-glycerol-3-phosphate acyltransferase [Deltaproteobacteria bacterium]
MTTTNATTSEHAVHGSDARRTAIIAANVVIFWMAIPLLLSAGGRSLDVGIGLQPLAPWSRWLGLAPLVGGGWLCAHAALVLIRRGKGMPISALPPTELVVTGPYRAFRHPIYTGFALLMMGLGVVLGSAGMTFIVVPCAGALWFATWVKLYEEPALVRRFGAAYRAHQRQTGLLLPYGLRWALRAVLLVLFRLVFRTRTEGAEHCPARGAAIYVSDHLSYLDLLLAEGCMPVPLTVPVTAEVFRRPIGRFLLSVLGGIPKRRYGPDRDAAQAIAAELAAGRSVGIAVEGERSWTGELGPLAPGVARFLARFDGPIVPVAAVGAYRLWPRWAPRPVPSAPVTVRIGEPFRLADAVAERSERAVAQLVRQRIQALRDPEEHAVDPSAFVGARPQLVLWRCPLCGAAETLSMQTRQILACSGCNARWRAGGGHLTLVEPASRAGERDTLAGWARRASGKSRADEQDPLKPQLSAQAALRIAPVDTPATVRLPSRGPGLAVLHVDRLEWRGPGGATCIALDDLRSVTTERADTVQLATEEQVLQLVLDRCSPLRWQQTIELLRSKPTAPNTPAGRHVRLTAPTHSP